MVNPKISDFIEKAGLSDKEAAVYGALLELGGGFPSKIAEHAKVKRSTTYKILLDLSIKGLVNEIEKRNKLFYQPEKPEKLLRYTRDRVRIAQDHYEYAEKAMPELSGLFSLTANKPRVLFFEGAQEIGTIYDDMISGSEKYEMLAFANASRFKDFLPKDKLQHFVRSKEKLGITTRGIAPDTQDDRKYNDNVFPGIHKKFWPDIRFIPKELFPFETEVVIYAKNKIAITKLGGENLIGIIIEDTIIHGTLRSMFEMAWLGAGTFVK